MELRTYITYQGSRTAHLPISRDTYAPVAGELENEEAAAYVGLRNFLRGLAVDRQEVKVQKGRVSPPFLRGVTFRPARGRCALIQEPVTTGTLTRALAVIGRRDMDAISAGR